MRFPHQDHTGEAARPVLATSSIVPTLPANWRLFCRCPSTAWTFDCTEAAASSTADNDRRLVEQLLATLPAGYRRVLTLYYLEERSYEEVAAILDMPVGTVKTHLHRAKRQLGEVYGGLRRL